LLSASLGSCPATGGGPLASPAGPNLKCQRHPRLFSCDQISVAATFIIETGGPNLAGRLIMRLLSAFTPGE
jgi:hypothetical protein